MIYIGQKKWDSCTDDEKISFADQLVEEGKQSKQIREMEWYLNYMFLDGNHYATYNSVTNSLETKPRKTGEVRMVVNITKSAIRSIKNYATREEPKWEVTPGDTDEDTITASRRAGKTLDFIYRKLHLEQMVAGVVDSGLNTSIGWVEIDWDKDSDDGLGEVKIINHDSFDIGFDSSATIYRGKFVGRFIYKSIKRSLSAIKNDKRYNKNKDDVQSDNSLAESPIKARILEKEGNGSRKNVIEQATIREVLIWDDEKNTKKGRIKLLTYADKKILRDEDMDYKEFPLYPFQISLNPNKILQRSWTADAIPLNKAIDRIVSQKIMYVNKALIYRIITESGALANVVRNEQGEFIEINKGRKFEQVQMTPLPTTIDTLLSQLNSFHEDVLSSHDASTGRLPAGARSGKTLEALQAAESNNLMGISQSLRSFLSVIGKRILEIISEKYVTSRIVKITDPEVQEDGTQTNYIRVVGKGSPAKDREDATIISDESEVIVNIGSWLGYTRDAQRETLMKLAELGVIPADEVLRQMEFPNINELSEKARAERTEKFRMEAEIAGRNQNGGQTNQGQGGQSNQMVSLADKENTQMMNGQQLPPTEGADMSHTQAHLDFIKTQTFTTASPEIQQIIAQHAQGELQAQGLLQNGQSQPIQ
jgi:hypothetical protein